MVSFEFTANQKEISLRESYPGISSRIFEQVTNKAIDYTLIKEIKRWIELCNLSEVKKEEDIWRACPIKEIIVKEFPSVWKSEYSFMTVEFEAFFPVLIEELTHKLKKSYPACYSG